MTDEDWRKEMIKAEKHTRKMRSDHRWGIVAGVVDFSRCKLQSQTSLAAARARHAFSAPVVLQVVLRTGVHLWLSRHRPAFQVVQGPDSSKPMARAL
jgi:hypothetical protein